MQYCSVVCSNSGYVRIKAADFVAYTAIIKLPFSTLGVFTHNEMLQAIDFLADDIHAMPAQDNISREVISQLEAYCQGDRFCFDLPMTMAKTKYQQHVREALLNIPAGKTLSYAGLAKQIGSGARAVAMACRHNPLPVVVPCHRIVAKNSMGGYAGATSGKPVETKRWLLEHEYRSESRSGRD